MSRKISLGGSKRLVVHYSLDTLGHSGIHYSLTELLYFDHVVVFIAGHIASEINALYDESAELRNEDKAAAFLNLLKRGLVIDSTSVLPENAIRATFEAGAQRAKATEGSDLDKVRAQMNGIAIFLSSLYRGMDISAVPRLSSGLKGGKLAILRTFYKLPILRPSNRPLDLFLELLENAKLKASRRGLFGWPAALTDPEADDGEIAHIPERIMEHRSRLIQLLRMNELVFGDSVLEVLTRVPEAVAARLASMPLPDETGKSIRFKADTIADPLKENTPQHYEVAVFEHPELLSTR